MERRVDGSDEILQVVALHLFSSTWNVCREHGAVPIIHDYVGFCRVGQMVMLAQHVSAILRLILPDNV